MKKKCVMFLVLLVFLSLGVFAQWKEISKFPVKDVYFEFSAKAATKADNGDIYKYDYNSGEWTKIGGPAYAVTVTKGGIWKLAADKKVWRYSGQHQTWIPLKGDPVDMLYSCGHFPYATEPGCGKIYKYDIRSEKDPNLPPWTKIADEPGEKFATGLQSLYRIKPDTKTIEKYYEKEGNWVWENLGSPDNEPVKDIYAGGSVYVLATKASTGDVYAYHSNLKKWEKIGPPGHTFVVTAVHGIYGLSVDKSKILAYRAPNGPWEKIGGPARMIYAGHELLYYTSQDGKLFLYQPQ